MPNRKKRIIIRSLIILAQIILFRNYLFPFISNQIIVKGLACTCPNAKVLHGESYLESITPDSLQKYDLDYSEIYFENSISTPSDLMGVGQYIIQGKVIGKSSISEGDGHYYPLFRIHGFREIFLFNIFTWVLHGLIIVQLILFLNSIRRKSNA